MRAGPTSVSVLDWMNDQQYSGVWGCSARLLWIMYNSLPTERDTVSQRARHGTQSTYMSLIQVSTIAPPPCLDDGSQESGQCMSPVVKCIVRGCFPCCMLHPWPSPRVIWTLASAKWPEIKELISFTRIRVQSGECLDDWVELHFFEITKNSDLKRIQEGNSIKYWCICFFYYLCATTPNFSSTVFRTQAIYIFIRVSRQNREIIKGLYIPIRSRVSMK